MAQQVLQMPKVPDAWGMAAASITSKTMRPSSETFPEQSQDSRSENGKRAYAPTTTAAPVDRQIDLEYRFDNGPTGVVPFDGSAATSRPRT